MKPMRWLLIAWLCGTALGCAQQAVEPVTAPGARAAVATPALLTLEADALALTRQRLASGDAALQGPFAALKRRADQALLKAPRSVTHKTATPPSGSKHDYVSMGPYWWPDPTRPDGLPYVQRDGQRNPQSAGNALDSIRLQNMLADVRDLALAYHFTSDIRYARHAAAAIRIWFLDPATRMNPHLRFGQSIPGIVDGRGIGIIDTRDLWLVIDAVALIAPGIAAPTGTSDDGALSAAELRALRRWFADYATWLDTSPLGRDAAAEKNNHGLFYDAQLAAYWLFVGETEKARRLVVDARTRRFAAQIDAQGRMPLELARTRPFHYQTFTLDAATRLARYGQVLAASTRPAGKWPATDPRCRAPEQHPGCPLDLWRGVIDGKSLRAALDFIAGAVVAPASWPFATALEPAPPLAPALPVLLRAQRSYAARGFDAPLAALQKIAPDHVAWLMWPVP
ncbi:MAG: alginate lyase family protein [Chitinophagaceae bacterium]|nr:alginate lyase family protein [Rubrivivax sp.]